jgi:hypothetical protein
VDRPRHGARAFRGRIANLRTATLGATPVLVAIGDAEALEALAAARS